MDEKQLLGLLGQGGLGAVLIVMLWTIGNRIVKALDKLSDRINEHTAKDLEHHGIVRTEVAELHGKVDGLLDAQDRYTPVGPVPVPRERARTPARGTEYAHIRRASTRNEDE